MARNIITFELRKGKDDDIEIDLSKAVSAENDRSSIIRTALRNYFSSYSRTTTASTPRHIVEDSMDNVLLQVAEKDDTQLDAALDSLLQF